MTFQEVWIDRILQCLSTVSYSVLVNGEPSQPFTPKVGLRQGDPLSSYLFILCMEVLSKRVSLLQFKRKITGLKVARRASPISHLFFVDDALFCFKTKPSSCRVLRQHVDSFCEMSGEMINFDKSIVIFTPMHQPHSPGYLGNRWVL